MFRLCFSYQICNLQKFFQVGHWLSQQRVHFMVHVIAGVCLLCLGVGKKPARPQLYRTHHVDFGRYIPPCLAVRGGRPKNPGFQKGMKIKSTYPLPRDEKKTHTTLIPFINLSICGGYKCYNTLFFLIIGAVYRRDPPCKPCEGKTKCYKQRTKTRVIRHDWSGNDLERRFCMNTTFFAMILVASKFISNRLVYSSYHTHRRKRYQQKSPGKMT